eukprot:TRINITY_DN64184_c0_g1_i1.p1 TRINITY_DN64184_c0_g1~~TRINITY_DN64184_c0_g1_i1.p1  ORF type:complete len:365 (-),score=67.62 TRINITY_DN64184_c0_g1_i1:85-1179(-)
MAAGPRKYGTISTIGSKYSFIDCPPVQKNGEQVFCPSLLLRGFDVGDQVEFDLIYNDKWQPQASNVGAKTFVSKGKGGYSKGKDDWQLPGGKNGKGAQSFFGVIDSIGPRFGFIDCPPVQDKYGTQVYCPGALLSGFVVGEHVDFDLKFNEQGQPQAFTLNRKGFNNFHSSKGKWDGGMKGGWDSGSKGKDSYGGKGYKNDKGGGKQGRFGTVYRVGKKFGFIECPDGTQVFCPTSLLNGISVGDTVDFDMTFNDNAQPQASNVYLKGYGKGGNGKSKGDKGGGKGYSSKFGTVSSIGSKFGFIECPPVEAQYGRQVFVPQALLHGISVGDKVNFDLMFNDQGQPQATNVSKKGGGKGDYAYDA